MTLKATFPILLATLLSPLLAAQPAAGQPPSMAAGDAALGARLWEVAAIHFQQCLADPALTADQKPLVAIRLSEAWIRDGKANEALALLSETIVAQHPETPFWKGQALAALGRFAEAIEILKPLTLDTQCPYRQEAGLTIASLRLALGDPQSALITLSELTENTEPQAISQTRLRQALILLDLDRVDEAREAMPAADNINPRDQSLAAFTDAQILLRENRLDEAVVRFQSLIANPSNLSMRRFQHAVIGLADALNRRGETRASADLLLNFIQEHPDSTLLDEMFKRLLQSLPDTPTAEDPVLQRLSQWIPAADIPSTGLVPTEAITAVAAWPMESTPTDLATLSMYTRALGLHRIGTPTAKDEAILLLKRLRLEDPEHFLASRSLLMTARWRLDDGRTDDAMTILQTLHENATSPLVKGEAAFLDAASHAETGDLTKASELYEKAADFLNGQQAATARLNAALVQLIDDPSMPIAQSATPELTAELQLEQALIHKEPAARKEALEAFLIANPTHLRMAEARLALAKTALQMIPPDLAFAKAQLDTIDASAESANNLPAAELALIRLRIDDLSGDSEKTIATARTLLADFPASSQAGEAAFILGRNLYQTGNFNDARLTLEKLAGQVSDRSRSQAAWLLAARSAASVPTNQSKLEALTLFDKAIAVEGPVTAMAKLEKARLMIDMNQLDAAVKFIGPWFATMTDDNPLHLPAGLLLGEAIYAQGNINPDSLSQALAIYDKLVATVKPNTADYDRLQYLRGRTLEQLPHPDNPAVKREKEAFIAYYSVLERDTIPEQWQYFELSGFRALTLLEKARRWPAAIACAKKIASFKGPRAEEAAARANQIQLKYMIWED